MAEQSAAEVDPHDDGHLLPQAEWNQVVAAAEEYAAEEAHPRTLGRTAFPSVAGLVQARWNGGAQLAGAPTFAVLHSAETPLANGYAASIASYFTRNANETSAHFMVGPDAAYQLLDTGLVAWHCGNGNRRSIGVEQAGYAAFSREQWLTEAGRAQVGRLAQLMREIRDAHGIGLYWMSDAQLRGAWNGGHKGGWTTHDQCRRVLGGTSHTDPMPNYPLDALMAAATGTTTPPPAPPAPPAAAPPTFAWNLPSGHYYGNASGPAQSHGGYYAAERDEVQKIQQWFIYLGCVPGVSPSAWNTSGWADGRWESPTDDACRRWHERYYPGQPYPTQLWSDDLRRLFASRP